MFMRGQGVQLVVLLAILEAFPRTHNIPNFYCIDKQ